jgi:hypothetical protein
MFLNSYIEAVIAAVIWGSAGVFVKFGNDDKRGREDTLMFLAKYFFVMKNLRR